MITPANLIAALLTLGPFLGAAFFPVLVQKAQKLPLVLRLAAPTLACLPYLLVATAAGSFRWGWLALYLFLPPGITILLWQAGKDDSAASSGDQAVAPRRSWLDFPVLMLLGLAVDLRWFEGAWPAHLAIFNKILLLDTGIYGFGVLRRLEGVGFDLRLRWRDVQVGLREAAFYAPIALLLGLNLRFLHLHAAWPGFGAIVVTWVFTFLFIAVPEELFFRGWMQNLLERRIGRLPGLLLTAVLFGLAHFNKRTLYFNWRYVLLAALAGIFYGRAWRQQRRVGASAVTHATVDSIWSLWLR